MANQIKFQLPEKSYLKDPQNSKYGISLIKNSIDLFAEIGFESFTFRKLAQRMDSSETSIYRYFENKHLLLIYLNSWYWEWVSYLIDIHTMNIESPEKRLKKAIHSLIIASVESPMTSYINENLLHQIIIKESSKSYHIHDVEKENQDGLFMSYKRLIHKLALIVLENNPKFEYPHTLCSTLFEMTSNQQYYSQFLPRLSDIKFSQNELLNDVEKMINFFAFKAIS